MTWKTTKYPLDGYDFMSQGEVDMYKLLKDNKDIKWTYQPEKVEIMEKYSASSGKKYMAMNYEADFLIKTPEGKGIMLEVKGQNDMIYMYRKGQKPSIKDNSELYRLKHKVIDYAVSKKGYTFMVVRHCQLKTPEYAGMFWEKDFEQLKKFKTQKRKDLCAKVPRIMDRIKELLNKETPITFDFGDTPSTCEWCIKLQKEEGRNCLEHMSSTVHG